MSDFPVPHGDIDRAWCLKQRNQFAQEEKALLKRGGKAFSDEKKAQFEAKMAAHEEYVKAQETYRTASTDSKIDELTAALTAILAQVAKPAAAGDAEAEDKPAARRSTKK